MLAKVYSAAFYGVDTYEIEIEVNAASGAPVAVVLRHGRHRVGTGISSSELPEFETGHAGRALATSGDPQESHERRSLTSP